MNELPEDTTVEEAIERLVLLHKVNKGLQQSTEEGMSQEQVEAYFQQRRKKRDQ